MAYSIKKFFNRFWVYFGAILFIVPTFFVILYKKNVFPFSQNTISNYDLLAQICPFIEHFFDVFEGKSSVFYTTSIVGGADVFQTLAYFFISPFSWIFLLFGHGNVYYGISIVLPIKLVCISFSAIIFLKKRFSSIPSYIILVLSILYAYSGYTFTANTYVNWMDFLIYLPFLVDGFLTIIDNGKPIKFIISQTLIIYTCFSLGCFALLLIYVIAILFVFTCVDKQNKKQTATMLCYAFVMAVIASLPVLLPSILSYMKCGRDTGFLVDVFSDLDFNPVGVKMSYVLSDTLFVFCTLYYFCYNGLKDKRNRFLLYVGLILLSPVLIDEVCMILNGGSYNSYAHRLGFLSTFYGLYMTAKTLSNLKDEKPNNSKPLSVKIISTYALLTITFVAIYLMILLDNKIIANKGNYKGFAGNFAHSTGGINVIASFFGIGAVVMIIITALIKLKVFSYKICTIPVIIVLAVQTCLFSTYLVSGNYFTCNSYRQFKSITAQLEDAGEDLSIARIKDCKKYVSGNYSFVLGTNSFSVFSSNIDLRNFSATTLFGYYGSSGKQKISVYGASASTSSNKPLILADCVLGYKYYVISKTDDNKDEGYHFENFEYLSLMENIENKTYKVYKNDYVIPSAFIGDGALNMDGSVADAFEGLYSFLGGNDGYFESYNLPPEKIIPQDNGTFQIKVNSKGTGWYYLDCDFPNELGVEVAYTTDYKKFLKDKTPANDGLKVNYLTTGLATLTLAGKNLTTNDILEHCHVKYITNEKAVQKVMALKEGYAERTAELSLSPSKFVCKANSYKEGQYLMLNYVALDGHKITVNGKTVKPVKNRLDFILIPLDYGENDIVVTYTSPYATLALILVFVSTAIIILLSILKRKTKMLDKIKTPIYYLSLVLAVIVIGVGILFPTTVFLGKLVKLI